MAEIKRLKRAVIREEYVAITGDFQKAVILGQLIYWSERVSDFDAFIAAENARAKRHGMPTSDATEGWLYKTAEELADETMLGLSASNMRRNIRALIDMGFISERSNPKYRWDRTKQYRVNLVEVVQALAGKGYTLEGYKTEAPFFKIENGTVQNRKCFSILENRSSDLKNQNAQNEKTIPEITTEITSETIKQREYVPSANASGMSPVQYTPYICTPEKEIEIEKKLERKKEREIDTPSAPAPGKSPRHKYGQYENVLLSDEDMGKLKAEFPADWEQRIERLSEYMASKGTKYKNHLATIRAWAKKDKDKEAKAGGTNGGTAGGYAEGDPRLGTWI